MGVHVDEAGGHGEPAGVHRVFGLDGSPGIANERDPILDHPDVADHGPAAGAVMDGAADDEEIDANGRRVRTGAGDQGEREEQTRRDEGSTEHGILPVLGSPGRARYALIRQRA